jgi:RecB family exonuclease
MFDFRPSEEVSGLTVSDSRLSDLPAGRRINYLSYSQLAAFATCPLQYKYRYVLQVPTPPSAALVFGDVIHQTMRNFYQRVMANQEPSKTDLLKILAENWTSIGYISKAQEERYKKEGQKILTGYFEKSFVPSFKPVALEQKFILKIDANLKAGGKIDRIDQVGETLEIIDYKTGKSVTQKEADKDLQLGLYALAAASGGLNFLGVREETLRPEKIKVSFYFFDQQKKVTAKRTIEELIQVKEEIKNCAATVNQSTFSPTPGKHCDFCEFRLICEAWR